MLQVNPPASALRPGEVGYSTVQAAIEAAATAGGVAVVAVWPNAASTNNPFGAYFENVVIHSSVRLQGVGPGGQYSDGAYVPGSILDGRAFGVDNPSGTAWLARSTPSGTPRRRTCRTARGDGAGETGQFTNDNAPTVDGFKITGGNQSDFAGNVNDYHRCGNAPVSGRRRTITQGGGVYLHSQARFPGSPTTSSSANSGAYGGAIRLGTP